MPLCLLAACSNPVAQPQTYTIDFRYQYFPDANNSNCEDTLLMEGLPDQVNGAITVVTVRANAGNRMYTLLKFDPIGYLPGNATVVKATLTLFNSPAPTANFVIEAHEISSAVDIENATWNTAYNQYVPAVIGRVTTDTGSALLAIELSPSVVQQWLTNRAANNGILLKPETEGVGASAQFSSREVPTGILRPMLTIVYTL